MPPHVRRGGARGRSNTPRHAAQARADLSAGRSAPRTQGKFAAFDEFCKRLRGIEIAARLARHGAKFDRIVTGLRPKFKFRRPFGKVFGNATDPIALETSVKRGAAESRDPRLKVSQAGVEREACACGRRR